MFIITFFHKIKKTFLQEVNNLSLLGGEKQKI
nr:MAG TPA: hypothetical protein [Caudoviricetes sp.]